MNMVHHVVILLWDIVIMQIHLVNAVLIFILHASCVYDIYGTVATELQNLRLKVVKMIYHFFIMITRKMITINILFTLYNR